MLAGRRGGGRLSSRQAGSRLYRAKDYLGAYKKWRSAADKGHVGAMYNVGSSYHSGTGVKQDCGEALRWYRKGAHKGNAYAMTNIGVLYRRGQGVKQDYGEAIRWFRKAAHKGDHAAMNNIGHMLYNGRGVRRDIAKALKCFLKSQLVCSSSHAAMWTWVCHGLLGKKPEASEMLKKYRSLRRPDYWEGSVLSFMAGEITPTKLLELAKSGDRGQRKGQLCQANFYIGAAKLISGDKAAAVAYLRRCVRTGETEYREYKSAQTELKILDAK